ncbi:MAG: DUF2147 domain-containing protein [Saprospiraceae bacterium]|nr:DUF2147 domain-containing protein [Saprospiraceae bacterium]
MLRQFSFIFFTLLSLSLCAQTPVGIWKNLDDTDGKEKSHIEIYEENGMLKGKVIKLLPAATITKCAACKGVNKGKNLVGMDILWGLRKKDNRWDNGQILDPKKGKIYDCSIEFDGPDKLKVRGYLKLSIFGRTQIWYRV